MGFPRLPLSSKRSTVLQGLPRGSKAFQDLPDNFEGAYQTFPKSWKAPPGPRKKLGRTKTMVGASKLLPMS